MKERCRDMEFSLYGREGDTLVKEVAAFKDLGRTLHQKDDY